MDVMLMDMLKMEKLLHISKHQPRMTTSSLLAAMGRTQMLRTFIKQGSINTGIFLNFLISLDLPENTVILLDNVRFHHASCIKDYVTLRKCHLLFTPPYSPWFQPIEGIFSIMKRAYYQNHTIEESIQSVQRRHFTSFFDKAFSIRQQPSK
jgi:transposase